MVSAFFSSSPFISCNHIIRKIRLLFSKRLDSLSCLIHRFLFFNTLRHTWAFCLKMQEIRRHFLNRSSVQFSCSVLSDFLRPHEPLACRASLSITNSRSLPKPMSIESMMPSNHLILCHPLLLLPSIFPSIRVLSSESVLLIRWPKFWSFSFSISPSNEYSGLISSRIDCFDLLAVQGTLKSLLQKKCLIPWKKSNYRKNWNWPKAVDFLPKHCRFEAWRIQFCILKEEHI